MEDAIKATIIALLDSIEGHEDTVGEIKAYLGFVEPTAKMIFDFAYCSPRPSKISVIKMIRQRCKCSLRHAKQAGDRLFDRCHSLEELEALLDDLAENHSVVPGLLNELIQKHCEYLISDEFNRRERERAQKDVEYRLRSVDRETWEIWTKENGTLIPLDEVFVRGPVGPESRKSDIITGEVE